MIVLDTHISIWWVHDDPSLPPAHKAYIQTHEANGLGISAISCWEVAKLVEYGRLGLPIPINDWLDQALVYPGMRLLELTPPIAIDST
jgi:PIN domain nuclease of toxin-antitoxin system